MAVARAGILYVWIMSSDTVCLDLEQCYYMSGSGAGLRDVYICSRLTSSIDMEMSDVGV